MVGLTVTDGIRDPDGSASDATVVVRRSRVRLTGNRLIGKPGGSSVVPTFLAGIIGVAGREGADVDLVDGRDHTKFPGRCRPLS